MMFISSFLKSQEDSSDGFSRSDDSCHFLKSAGQIAIVSRGKPLIYFFKGVTKYYCVFCPTYFL